MSDVGGRRTPWIVGGLAMLGASKIVSRLNRPLKTLAEAARSVASAFASGFTEITSPVRPLSRPVSTITLSPLRILAAITAPPARAK